MLPEFALGPCTYYTDNLYLKKYTQDWVILHSKSDVNAKGAIIEELRMRVASDVDVIPGQFGVEDSVTTDMDGTSRIFEISGRYVGTNDQINRFINKIWQMQTGSQYDTDGYTFLQRHPGCWPADYRYRDNTFSPSQSADALPAGWTNPVGLVANVYVSNFEASGTGGTNTVTFSFSMTEGRS